ncbi:unnamed protein product [Phaedon cochleariae]|uniref:Transcription termination factor, mitochondrial n=1 Tax=Phaedon cochleariae TaxID=80249 RepID=A0A9P0DZ40_PHACE|nr:unnamed protein product [Phaedon cochleariae]
MILKNFPKIINFIGTARVFDVSKCTRHTRMLSNAIRNPVPKVVVQPPVYIKTDHHYKICKQDTIRKLQALFGLRIYEATEMFMKFKKFSTIPTYRVGENYFFCVSQGMSKTTLRQYPEILAESDVQWKIEKLKILREDINVLAPLILLSQPAITNFLRMEIKEKRIEKLAKMFEVEEDRMCQLMVQKPFLITLNLDFLQTNLRLLTAYGIPKADIVRDLWVLRYSSASISERMELARKNKIEKMKTWMVRAQQEILDNYMKRRSDNKSILGNNSLVEYLSERLDTTEDVARFIISKQPALQKKSLKKMNEMIEFLLINGFKTIHICRTPKILLHKVDTVKKRLKEMKDNDMQLDALSVLTKSQKQYAQALELLKANKSKIKYGVPFYFLIYIGTNVWQKLCFCNSLLQELTFLQYLKSNVS